MTDEVNASPESSEANAAQRADLSWRKKFALLGGSILAALVCLELILRVASLGLHLVDPSTALAQAAPATDNGLRVLCFGESMTAGYGQTPYSEILQRRLDARATPSAVRVINAGFVSAHTPFLVSRLEALLDEHDPDMVIAMMGINDQFYFTDIGSLSLPTEAQLLLLELKSYRLLRMIWFHLFRSPETGVLATPEVDPSYRPVVARAYKRTLEEAHNHSVSGRTEEAESMIVGLIETLRAESGGGEHPTRIAPDQLNAYYTCFSFLLDKALRAGRPESVLALYEDAVAIHGETPFFCRGLAALHLSTGNEELAKDYLLRAEETANSNMLGVTKESFRRTREILRERDVTFVALQYPLRPLSTLQHLLDRDESVVYVDLDGPFRQALAEHDYTDLFVDRFAGDFGHCTERGNQVIADHLITQVFEPLLGSEQ